MWAETVVFLPHAQTRYSLIHYLGNLREMRRSVDTNPKHPSGVRSWEEAEPSKCQLSWFNVYIRQYSFQVGDGFAWFFADEL